MSLINQMLKDLEEKRKKDKTQTSDKQIPSKTSSLDTNTILDKEPKKSCWMLYTSLTTSIVGLIIIILILVFTIDFETSKKKANVIKPSISAVQQNAKMPLQQNQPSNETKTAVAQLKPKILPTPETHKLSDIAKQKLNQVITQTHPEPVKKPRKTIKPPYHPNATITIIKPLSRQQKLQQNYDIAFEQINSGRTDEAIKLLKHILTIQTDNKEARVSLAAILIKSDRNDEAQQVLNIGLKQNPHYANYAILQAHLLVQSGNVQQALQVLQNAEPPSISNNPHYFAFMAALYLQQQQYGIAAKFYQQLIKYDSQNAKWWLGLAISQQKLGQRLAAKEAFENAVSIGKLSPELVSYVTAQLNQ